MDWLELIRQFRPIKAGEAPQFAPSREKDQAVAAYNRSLSNIGQDSLDIALIALKKLASSYPRFSQASLLLTFCLAQEGRYAEAAAQVRAALDAGLTGEMESLAQEAQKKLDRIIFRQKQTAVASKKKLKPQTVIRKVFRKRPAAGPAGSILQKTGRRAEMRIASEKERQAVIRQGEKPAGDTGHAIQRHAVDLRRILLISLMVLLAASLLAWAAFAWLPGMISRSRERQEARTRLDWLVSRLEEIAGQNPAVQDILDEYHQMINQTAEAAQP